MLKLAAVARELVWRSWDDVYLVYQPSSTETHVFNETTALILRCLERGPLAEDELKACTEHELAADAELDADVFSFAVERLEELGLIEHYSEAGSFQCSSVT